MADVRYYLERPKKGEPARITLHFRYAGATVRVSTGERVPPEAWDRDRQRVQARRTYDSKEYARINRVLDDLAGKARETYSDYRRAGKIRLLTVPAFQKILAGYLTGEKTVNPGSVGILDYFRAFVEERRTNRRYASGSWKAHKSALNSFEAYCKAYGEPTWEDIDLFFMEAYRDFIITLSLNDNTVHRRLANFKVMLGRAAKQKVTEYTEFRYIRIAEDLGVRQKVADRIALYMEELTHLYRFRFSEPHLGRTRDLFLMGCFTGLRHSDWNKIRLDRVREFEGVQMLEVLTQKGSVPVMIPLHPIVRDIAERHGWNLPAVPVNQVINRQLKEMANEAGFTHPVTYRESIGGRTVERTKQKWELISTHTARRSFATNGYLSGMNIDMLMSVTGHTKKETFMGYIKAPVEMRAKLVSESPFFNIEPINWKPNE